MAAESLRMLALTDVLMLYSFVANQNGFVAEND